MFHIKGVGMLDEKDNKSYLDDLFITTEYSNRVWEGKLPFANKTITNYYSSAKVVEAFQVVFHK